MTTIVLRLVKGSALTWQELDDNFSNLNNAKYEAGDSPIFDTITATNYVGLPPSSGSYYYSATAPSTPSPGDRWVSSTEGVLYTYVDDGSTTQWVDFSASVGASTTAVWGGISGTLSDQTDLQNALNTVLPSQTGNANKVLTTNGTTAAWTALASAAFNWTTYTPTDLSGGSITFADNQCKYMQLGQIVFVMGRLLWPTTSDTNSAKVTCPPVAPASGYPEGMGMVWFSNVVNQVVFVATATPEMRFNYDNNYKTNADLSGRSVEFIGWYRTA